MPQNRRHFIRQFLSYKVKAIGAHGLHSPFVYELYTRYIRKKRQFIDPNIEALRNKIKRSYIDLEVRDFKTGTTRIRKLADEAKSSPSTAGFSAFLCGLMNHLEAHTVLETGTSLGFNALYLAKSNVHEVWTLEGNESISGIAAKNFENLGVTKVKIITGDIHDTFAAALAQSQADVIFLDADHRSVAVAKFIEMIAPHLARIKCIILHDIYWSRDMTLIWEQLTKDSRFQMTIDLFQAGLLFPNQNMEKQHFVVKF